MAKQKKESTISTTLGFTADHLWVRCEAGRALIGISEYGQDSVGEIVAIELPSIGDRIEKGEPFGEIESARTVQEMIAPVSGVVVNANAELEDNPALVNEDPHHGGWFIEIALTDERELDELMPLDEYEDYVASVQEED